MSDINALEARIGAALERVRRGVDALDNATAAPAPVSEGETDAVALRGQLDEERTANAQLEERVRALKERQDSKLSALETQVAEQASQLADYDREIQRLQQVNAELRSVAAEMREALMEDVSEPEMVNRAVIAELDAVKAARAADRTEIETVMAQMAPMLKGAQ